ncbi:hypothetical protein BE17_52415 [Sorangium cellulosum]|uniref:Uncharacterized protein n=1 Tax=Sorangium cellulosum TaxID=56 RepID=A0A150R8M9_SORCE|nr:hypothetical protein BE17_52415 [Sorangium cellulosum]
MNPGPIFIYLLPLLTVLAVGLLGSTRRLGFWPAIILSVLLTPIGGFLVALISGPKYLKQRALPARAASRTLRSGPSMRV